jgi:hypothetical protein
MADGQWMGPEEWGTKDGPEEEKEDVGEIAAKRGIHTVNSINPESLCNQDLLNLYSTVTVTGIPPPLFKI